MNILECDIREWLDIPYMGTKMAASEILVHFFGPREENSLTC